MFVGTLEHALLEDAEALRQKIVDEGQLRTLSRMMAANHRMTEMLGQLLDLTRARLADGVGFALARKPVDLVELIRRAVGELRATNPAREIVIETSGDCSTRGDPDRLVQVFSNLVGQFAPPRVTWDAELGEDRRRRAGDRDPDPQSRCHPARAIALHFRAFPRPNRQRVATWWPRARALHLAAGRLCT